MRTIGVLVALAVSLLTACPAAVEEPGGVDLSLQRESDPLTELGAEAVALAPRWLRHDLGVALRLQDPDRADELAALLLEAADPRFVDEIAFAIAHVSPEVLAEQQFHPVLLAENAALVYARDADLDYVELTETGTAGIDDDYWTTATYTWERGGSPVQEEIDRDLYYWHVVHPRLEDEHPWYVDGWAPCTSSGLQCASTPDEGQTWRRFLWEGAEETCPEGRFCPVLRDRVGNARKTDDEAVRLDIAWNGLSGGDARGAVREIVEWMLAASPEGQRWLTFGAQGERSIQPNRIYGLGRGNCGEWADMTDAALRTVLLPGLSVKPTSWDHTWNSFWTGERWAEMEPVNYCIDCTYHGSPGTVGARGDTSLLIQTADYSLETFTMRVEVLDDDGAPVAGASVQAFAPWVIDQTTYWDSAGELPTDETGSASFVLETGHRFGVRVETPLGSWPEADNSLDVVLDDDVPAGAIEDVDVDLAFRVPAGPDLSLVPAQGERPVTLVFRDQQGRALTSSQRFGHGFSTPLPAPDLVLALVDRDGYEAFKDGEPFEATWAGGNADSEIEVPAGYRSILLLANPALLAAWTGEIELASDSATFAASWEILPGGWLALALDPA